jgi:pimeloyl-ACP methyl ester carboxylesterase
MLHRMPPAERRQVNDHFDHESGRVVFEIGYWMPDIRHAARVDPSKVTRPVLVVAGREDRIAPAGALRRVARCNGETYRECEHHAHWLIGELRWHDIGGEVLSRLKSRLPA